MLRITAAQPPLVRLGLSKACVEKPARRLAIALRDDMGACYNPVEAARAGLRDERPRVGIGR